MQVRDFVARRLQSTNTWELDAAGRAAPEDPRIFARMSGVLAAEAARSSNEEPENAEAGKETNRIRIESFARRARRLDPEIQIPRITLPPKPKKEEESAEEMQQPLSAEDEFVRGEALRKGDGVEKNYREAFARYQRAAALGYAPALHRIGVMYAEGDGLPKDGAKAVEWYRKSAKQGFAEAQFDLGVRVIKGDGVEKDVQAGLDLYSKAAEQGYAEAQYGLGNHLINGNGITKNVKTGLDWYRKAAAQGYQEAIDALKHYDANGRYVR